MATREQRITALEQKKFRNPDLATWTDFEILEFLGFPDGATDEQLETIAKGNEVQHGHA